ncbi:MAG: helix-turn-helix transcriptional regulator [Ginsengibacter sp.]|jgi:DNA-binding CsgD family transcriptional regulator
MDKLKNLPTSEWIASPGMQQQIDSKIAHIITFENEIPGILVIHNLRDFSVVHMSEAGLKILQTNLQDMKALGLDYYKRYLSPDSYEYLSKFMDLIGSSKDGEDISFLQQIRANENEEWKWYASNSKIFFRDENGLPLLSISYVIPITGKQFFGSKIQRAFNENIFLKKNQHLFATLTKREKEILIQMALSKSSEEIAEKNNISKATVDTHRRNIRKKIGFENFYEIVSFAQAFNLI